MNLSFLCCLLYHRMGMMHDREGRPKAVAWTFMNVPATAFGLVQAFRSGSTEAELDARPVSAGVHSQVASLQRGWWVPRSPYRRGNPNPKQYARLPASL